MRRHFWLDDEAWAAIELHLPRKQPGARRVDDRRIISGILHVLKAGCRWQDCPAILPLTADNVAHFTMAGPLMDAAGRARCLIADKGYDANALRKRLHAKGTDAIIPRRSNRKVPIDYDEVRYKGRWRIEAAFCRLKDFRRIATRYDKLAQNFLSAVALATLVAFLGLNESQP